MVSPRAQIRPERRTIEPPSIGLTARQRLVLRQRTHGDETKPLKFSNTSLADRIAAFHEAMDKDPALVHQLRAHNNGTFRDFNTLTRSEREQIYRQASRFLEFSRMKDIVRYFDSVKHAQRGAYHHSMHQSTPSIVPPAAFQGAENQARRIATHVAALESAFGSRMQRLPKEIKALAIQRGRPLGRVAPRSPAH